MSASAYVKTFIFPWEKEDFDKKTHCDHQNHHEFQENNRIESGEEDSYYIDDNISCLSDGTDTINQYPWTESRINVNNKTGDVPPPIEEEEELTEEDKGINILENELEVAMASQDEEALLSLLEITNHLIAASSVKQPIRRLEDESTFGMTYASQNTSILSVGNEAKRSEQRMTSKETTGETEPPCLFDLSSKFEALLKFHEDNRMSTQTPCFQNRIDDDARTVNVDPVEPQEEEGEGTIIPKHKEKEEEEEEEEEEEGEGGVEKEEEEEDEDETQKDIENIVFVTVDIKNGQNQQQSHQGSLEDVMETVPKFETDKENIEQNLSPNQNRTIEEGQLNCNNTQQFQMEPMNKKQDKEEEQRMDLVTPIRRRKRKPPPPSSLRKMKLQEQQHSDTDKSSTTTQLKKDGKEFEQIHDNEERGGESSMNPIGDESINLSPDCVAKFDDILDSTEKEKGEEVPTTPKKYLDLDTWITDMVQHSKPTPTIKIEPKKTNVFFIDRKEVEKRAKEMLPLILHQHQENEHKIQESAKKMVPLILRKQEDIRRKKRERKIMERFSRPVVWLTNEFYNDIQKEE